MVQRQAVPFDGTSDRVTDGLGKLVVIDMLDVKVRDGYGDVVDILYRLELAFGVLQKSYFFNGFLVCCYRWMCHNQYFLRLRLRR